MEIRDPLHGTIELSAAEQAVVGSIAFQRLRFIKQLGFAEFSFPGATHNRFLHSLGVCHLAGLAFDSIFKNHKFSSAKKRSDFREIVKLAALLHDIGHGPLSHTSEEVMPLLKDLNIEVYKNRRTDMVIGEALLNPERQANHEDYTIKFITDSSLTKVIEKNYPSFSSLHVACLIDKTLQAPDDFFKDGELDFRTVLSQTVSSELDVDRMDYLGRDAYFCGTNYGKVELNWLLSNLSLHKKDSDVHLAINRRALYTFDDFLLARHHMHLMVYFHHKSIIYEELLYRYLTSPQCTFSLSPNIDDYIKTTDYTLYEHMGSEDNQWAKRISSRNPHRVLFELHTTHQNNRTQNMTSALEKENIEVIYASSTARVSKYHSSTPEEKSFSIYVVDEYDKWAKPYPIEESTEIFQKYEEIRRIERLYVKPEDFSRAEKFITETKI